jgi:hypothetical protein
MSSPAAPEAAKDALYDHDPIDLSDDDSSSNASSLADVVGDVSSQLRHSVPAASAAPPSQQQQQHFESSEMQLHEDEVQPPTKPLVTAASTAQTAPSSPHASSGNSGNNGVCCQCGQPMGNTKGATTKDGPLHPQCIAEYKFLHQPRCRYCNIRFHDGEVDSFVKDPVTGYLYHPECRDRAEAGKPFVPPTKEGEVRKFAIARSRLSRHNWKSRYFVLSPANGGIRYYANKAAATAGAAGDRKGSDAKSDGSASYDPDADPDREENEAKRSKGVVPLNSRSRLLTRPNMSNYKVTSSSASDNDIGIIFFETKESQKELRLVFQCPNVEERNAWIAALEAYIYTVDDPADYSDVRAAIREKEKAKEAKEAKKEDKEEEEEKK